MSLFSLPNSKNLLKVKTLLFFEICRNNYLHWYEHTLYTFIVAYTI